MYLMQIMLDYLCKNQNMLYIPGEFTQLKTNENSEIKI